MRNYKHIEVRPIAGALGAEIAGVDMARDLDSEVVSEVRQALLDHLVIFLREQKATPLQQLAFARKFGEPIEYPQLKGLPESQFITPVVKLEHERNNFGGIWHSDTTYLPVPPMGSMLLAHEVPPYGGDTMFANQYLAYETLSDGMKKMLAGLRAVHSDTMVAGPQAGKNKGRSTKHRDGADWRETRSSHPVVRTNPETGRKMLFVNKSYTVGFEGMTEAESKPLLDFLMEHGNRPEFTFRFRYEKGSIAFWDNRSTKHIALGDTGPFRRLMRRVQISGDKPV
jgi:taurine dioxygenase